MKFVLAYEDANCLVLNPVPLMTSLDRESGHNKLTASLWASEDIKHDVEQFFDSLETPSTSVEVKRQNLSEDMNLITSFCPNLRSISLFIFSDDFPGLLGPSETWMWQPLETLDHLENMTIICHEWDEISALFRIVGAKLGRLCLSLGRNVHTPTMFDSSISRVPALDTLFSTCPDLHTLKIDFRTTPLTLSSSVPDQMDLTKLKKLSAGLCLSKKAFVWLWKNCPNLEEILIPSISSAQNLETTQDRFNKETLIELFKSNPMKNLRKFNIHFLLTDIPTATFLVESLRNSSPDIQEIGKLMIKVSLPGNNYENQEEILEDVAKLMMQMRRFKVFCESMDDSVSDQRVTKVRWDWEKVGIFQSFAEIEQLNAMVEPGYVE